MVGYFIMPLLQIYC